MSSRNSSGAGSGPPGSPAPGHLVDAHALAFVVGRIVVGPEIYVLAGQRRPVGVFHLAGTAGLVVAAVSVTPMASSTSVMAWTAFSPSTRNMCSALGHARAVMIGQGFSGALRMMLPSGQIPCARPVAGCGNIAGIAGAGLRVGVDIGSHQVA